MQVQFVKVELIENSLFSIKSFFMYLVKETLIYSLPDQVMSPLSLLSKKEETTPKN